MPVPTSLVPSARPAFAVLAAIPAIAVAGLLPLAMDRAPHPVAHQSSVRADGCVMLCDPAPPAPSYSGIGCLTNCATGAPTPPLQPGGCVMFCTEPGWKGER
ncbi:MULTISPECIES: hypothetical protein [unclassified Nocardia]|uniref:hypothetical protein n=1 Tax=unclassified Nocardia TaxID=2637762 RepID=UPI001CE42544|nr:MULTISPECIES: hypothetical protein [unclassified Nocardia]